MCLVVAQDGSFALKLHFGSFDGLIFLPRLIVGTKTAIPVAVNLCTHCLTDSSLQQ